MNIYTQIYTLLRIFAKLFAQFRTCETAQNYSFARVQQCKTSHQSFVSMILLYFFPVSHIFTSLKNKKVKFGLPCDPWHVQADADNGRVELASLQLPKHVQPMPAADL